MSSAVIRLLLAYVAVTALGVITHAQDTSLPYQWINARQYGALGDGKADDTRAIEAALLAAQTNPKDKAVFFPAGTYCYSRNIHLPGIVVYGAGMHQTIFEATDSQHSAWVLSGESPAIADLTIHALSSHAKRNTNGAAVGLEVKQAAHFSLLRVKIGPVDSAGILIRESGGHPGKYAQIRDCIVNQTLADGIHMTATSHHIEVSGNKVSETGDDFIAVVSYRADGGLCHDINIHDNLVENQSHGRGISVVGGSDVTISANVIKRTSGAGIYLASEISYDTYGDINIQVLDNILSDLVTSGSRGHGAILLLGRTNPSDPAEPFEIKNVTISGNHIDGSARSGLFIGAFSSTVTIVGNEIAHTQACGISIYAKVADISVGTGEINSPPNIIRSCGEHGIQINPAGSRGVLRICGVNFQSVNAKDLNHINVISIGGKGTFDQILVSDNRLEQPAGPRPRQYIESLTPLIAVRNTANIELGSFIEPN